MISVEDKEVLRRERLLAGKSLRQIEQETGHSRRTIHKALANPEAEAYHLGIPRSAPVLGPYKAQIDALLKENERLPARQRYTAQKIYTLIHAAGYQGSESGVHVYVWRKRQEGRRPDVYLPLAYDPGRDAQVDWGEADIVLAGEQVTAQFLLVRLCYSRKLLVRAYPHQRQEAFLDGQMEAFQFFGGVPHNLWYDNLTTAVQQVLCGRVRKEQRRFTAFRSHHLFEAQFCTPGEGHEKGGVENSVGYVRRNLFLPLIQAESWVEVNAELLRRCQAEDERQVRGQSETIGAAFAQEREQLLPLPAYPFMCRTTIGVTLNGYSQVTFETNRYSVPVELARPHLTLRASPFEVEILDGEQRIAAHVRSYGHAQEVFEPLHYLALLERSPRAFDHAKPMRQLRAHWPPVFERALAHLRAERANGITGTFDAEGVREFVRILKLVREYPEAEVADALAQVLDPDHGQGRLSADAVRLYLRRREKPEIGWKSLDLSGQPGLNSDQAERLAAIHVQPVCLDKYDQLLSQPAPTIPTTTWPMVAASTASTTAAVENANGGEYVRG